MSFGDAFDILLCLLILTVAIAAVGGKDLFGAVALYIVYGLLIAIAWVRLGAIDVGLAEGAIGAGLTGVLLFRAASRLEVEKEHRLAFSPFGILLCIILASSLGWVVVTLAQPAPGLVWLVQENLQQSGAENPVTAVLLNFRGWDTLMESIVLLIALIGVWSLAPDDAWGGRPGLRQQVRPDGVMATFGRFLPPLGLVVAVYLVWVGTSAPGGAFQGGTVLAAVWLLAMMAALNEPPPVTHAGLRWVLIAGPLVFLGIGLWGFTAGTFMTLAEGEAKGLMLGIELALALSIAATLALLVVGPPRKPA